MLTGPFDLAAGLMRLAPPEAAHEATLKSLELGLFPRATAPDHPSLALRFCGLALPNPVGIAAGFDKDARVPDAVLALGCGFAEVGTLTPLPQDGNPRPRIFRLARDRAVINRLGFNNGGQRAALDRLRCRFATEGVIGVNIGANKDSEDRIADYVQGLEAFSDVASYFTVNISSPNTPGLRDLQSVGALDELLGRADGGARAASSPRARHAGRSWSSFRPTSPRRSCATSSHASRGTSVDAIAVSNTTLSRRGLTDPAAREAGGLSGRPLFHRSTVMLARVYRATRRQDPADRYRRHRQRRGGARQDRGGRHADPALHRADLRGSGIDPAHQGASDASRAPRQCRGRHRSRRPRRRDLGGKAARGLATHLRAQGSGRRVDLINREMSQIGTTTMAPSSR